MKLTQALLKEILYYNAETGIFTWKVKKARWINIGDIAGCNKNKTNGYWIIHINGKNYYAHRLAFLYMEGYLPENHVDHIDRDKSNNKWDNLREVSITCNLRNRDIAKNNKSGIIGVCHINRDNKWRASITINKKDFNLGTFDNILDAVKARWKAEIEYNYPNCNTTSSAYNYLKEHGAIGNERIHKVND